MTSYAGSPGRSRGQHQDGNEAPNIGLRYWRRGDESNGVTLSKSIAGFKDLGGEEVSIERRLWQMSKRTRIQNAILNSKKYQPEWQRRCLVFIPRVIFYL